MNSLFSGFLEPFFSAFNALCYPRNLAKEIMPQCFVHAPSGLLGFGTVSHQHLPESSSAVFTTEISANISSSNLLSTQGKQKWFLSLCLWTLLASPSHELPQHPANPHSCHVEYRNTSSYCYFLQYYPASWQYNPSGEWKQIIFGSTLHSCIWFSFWLSPLAGPIVLLPVIWISIFNCIVHN